MWPVHCIHRHHVTIEMLDGCIILSQKVKVEQVSTQQGTVGCLDVDFWGIFDWGVKVTFEKHLNICSSITYGFNIWSLEITHTCTFVTCTTTKEEHTLPPLYWLKWSKETKIKIYTVLEEGNRIYFTSYLHIDISWVFCCTFVKM